MGVAPLADDDLEPLITNGELIIIDQIDKVGEIDSAIYLFACPRTLNKFGAAARSDTERLQRRVAAGNVFAVLITAGAAVTDNCFGHSPGDIIDTASP